MTENTAVRVIFSVLAASPPSPMAGGIASPCPCLAFEVFGVPLDAFAALAGFAEAGAGAGARAAVAAAGAGARGLRGDVLVAAAAGSVWGAGRVNRPRPVSSTKVGFDLSTAPASPPAAG